MGLDRGLHPDFGSARDTGIPYNVVPGRQPKVAVHFEAADESDVGPYPIPPRPSIELSSDRHLLLVDRDACRLYELYGIHQTTSGWQASSGAIWNLRSNALRPAGWTSADGAGLPILPGLVRYDEVARGVIRHALRFTTMPTRRAYLYPARHYASTKTDSSLPPMGLRVRLKASVDLSGFSQEDRVILQALKRYGMLLADNGQPWFITGVPDSRWNDDDLHKLNRITGADLEVVDTSTLRNGSISGGPPPTPRPSRPTPTPMRQQRAMTFTFDALVVNNTRGQVKPAFPLNQQLVIVARYTVRNLQRSYLQGTVRRLFQVPVNGRFATKAVSTDTIIAVNGTNPPNVHGFTPAVTGPLRIVVAITLGNVSRQRAVTIQIIR